MAGTKEITIYDKQTLINNNEFLLLKSGRCLMTENIAKDDCYRSLLLFFDDELVFDFIEKYRLKYKNSTQTKTFFVFAYDAYLTQFLESLIQVNALSTHLKPAVLKLKLEELLLYLSNSKGLDFLYLLLEPHQYQRSNFKQVIESNKYHNLSIEELAFLCNMSISTFKREFKKLYLETPMKWFQEKRLEHSAFLLAHKKLRPSDIYDKVGYESLSSFVQAYKKKFGITPKQHFI
jgi:AraC-like DNA-binding protein